MITSGVIQHLFGQSLHLFQANTLTVIHFGSTRESFYLEYSALEVVIHCFWYFYLQGPIKKTSNLRPMCEKNRRLVTDELVEFEKWPVEVGDFRRISDHFRGIYKIYLKRIKQNRKMSTCNWLDLESPESSPTMPKNFPGTSNRGDFWA